VVLVLLAVVLIKGSAPLERPGKAPLSPENSRRRVS
jgi:hypothetical protein